MGPFLALVVIVLFALLIVRLGSSALQLTGMSQPIAQFQAASALATLLVTFMGSSERGIGFTFFWLGVVALAIFSVAVLLNLRVVKVPVESFQKWMLKRVGIVHIRDYDYLLNLRDGYVVFDKEISEDHPWLGKTFAESRPSDAGIVVLGIYRVEGEFLGAPDKDSRVEEGDVLMVYGRDEDVKASFNLNKSDS